MNAPAPQTFELIVCEEGLGRMAAKACARRYELGNTPPGKLAAAGIEPFAYTVRVQGLPVRCRTLDDVIALVARYGEAKPA